MFNCEESQAINQTSTQTSEESKVQPYDSEMAVDSKDDLKANQPLIFDGRFESLRSLH